MGNTSVSVKELILNEEDAQKLISANNVEKKRKFTYQVIMQSGCDFAVEKREKGKKSASRLVVLVSQGQYYIEEAGSRKKLTKPVLLNFVKGMTQEERVELPAVGWLSYLRNDRRTCACIVESLTDKKYQDTISEMMRHGLYVIHDSGDSMDDAILNERFTDSRFGDERYGDEDRRFVNDFAPVVDNDPFGDTFGRPASDNIFGATIINRDFFDPEGVDTLSSWAPKSYKARVYSGHNPAKKDYYGSNYLPTRGYEGYQIVFYALSPALYKYMIRQLTVKNGITTKALLTNFISKWNSKESLVFQSFAAFALIECAYGIEAAKKAMDYYYESSIKDLVPFSQLSYLLYGCYVGYCQSKDRPAFPSPFKRKAPEYNLECKAFLKYLFEASIKQGYGNNMNLFIYQWGQVLFLQELMNLRQKDKYPQYLASKAVEVAGMVPDYVGEIEKNIWFKAAEHAKDLEYKGDKYQIIVPRSAAELISEADSQHNCLKSYESRILCQKTKVCFLRYTDPERAGESLVTIEVDENGYVHQCKAKCNRAPSVEIWKFILEWEKIKKLNDSTYSIPDELRGDEWVGTVINR